VLADCARFDEIVGLGQPHRTNERHAVVPIQDAARERKTAVDAKADDVAESRNVCISANWTGPLEISSVSSTSYA
jgi:hypothetical protein